ncbi:MAG: 6,7-dimethyl-8-ribityllumazine synthase [Candidatus Omnitrophica bacterium]|nr:6,7-dimethyl-8-ribityllumazine synthase [Candidatus Omnitrophota bacterium]
MPTKKASSSKSPRIAVVVAQFNEYITDRLLAACLDELKNLKVPQKNVAVSKVPGSFEIPVVALKYAKKKTIDAVICLGAVIRGETYHFETVADGVAQGVMQVSLLSGKPVIFGVLTTDTVDQANRRAEEKGDNKGRDAAQAAIDMIGILRNL